MYYHIWISQFKDLEYTEVILAKFSDLSQGLYKPLGRQYNWLELMGGNLAFQILWWLGFRMKEDLSY